MAGSLIGSVVNGVYTKTDASTEATKNANSNINTSKSTEKEGTQYNEEMFLQLLVAEMQYQDPLEPTDNGEYVSQLASFTQIEAIQSVQSDMKSIQANSLVGKYVIMTEDDTTVSGKVDYVTTDDDGQIYLSVNDKLYKAENLDSVVDESYYTAVIDSQTLMDAISKLPSVDNLTLADESKVTAIRKAYDSMSDYAKGYVDSDSLATLTALEEKLAKLKKSNDSSDTDSDSSTEGE
ncbi:MAG: flagellar hook capping protein [Pseudobutyrivibrio sp.]|nr:flagellar hook capping protein [Pseudobutyrivibrio sp.]